MKKFLSVILALFILFSFSLISQAADSKYIDDSADLLTIEQEAELSSYLEQIFYQYDVDVVIHTTMSSYGADIGDYAENYYISNGYSKDGLVFVINLNNNEVGMRDFFTYCQGSVYHTFGFDAYDSNYGYINSEVLPYLVQEDYYGAFEKYITLTESYLADEFEYKDTEQWINETEGYYYDDEYVYYEEEATASDIIFGEIIVIVVGAIVAFAITFIMKGKMNTAVVKTEASDYVKAGSLNITRSMDIFTHRTVTKTPIPKNNTKSSGGGVSSGGGGGGFSRSSNSGGGGGKF